MAASFGKLDEFDPAAGKDWFQYVEQMDYYFLANGISSTDKKRAVLINSVNK